MTRVAIALFMLTLTLGISWTRAADAPAAAPGAAPAIDLSDPLKTYGTLLAGRLADHLPTIMACMSVDAAKKPLIETLLAHEVAKHQLETAALAKFGPEASKVILDTLRPIQDELLAQKARLAESRPDVDKDGTTAVLYLREERHPPEFVKPFDEGIHFIKTADGWKIDAVRFLHQEDQDDPDRAQAQRTSMPLYAAVSDFMHTLAAGINKGSYQSAAQVRAALDDKWNALSVGAQGEVAPAKSKD